MSQRQTQRRKAALNRLNVQLKAGTYSKDKNIPLTEKDVKRITKEVGILKEKIK